MWGIYEYILIPFVSDREICIIHSEHAYIAHNTITSEGKIISGTSLKKIADLIRISRSYMFKVWERWIDSKFK